MGDRLADGKHAANPNLASHVIFRMLTHAPIFANLRNSRKCLSRQHGFDQVAKLHSESRTQRPSEDAWTHVGYVSGPAGLTL